MAWRNTARICGAALAIFSLSATMTRSASAQEIERVLAGIRLGSRSTAVLAKFGNPNEVVVGDVTLRANPLAGLGGPGGPGDQGGLPGVSGAPGFPGGGITGLPSVAAGIANGYAGALNNAAQDDKGGDARGGGGGGFAGFPGAGAPYGAGNPDGPGGPGGASQGSGPFGNTLSSAAPEQEVTWIYNRKVNNNQLSYEFLIGPAGDVSQIRITGYSGPGIKTRRGIALGSTYKDVIRTYGYPEEHMQSGRVLVTNYRKAAHISFQFLNQSGQANLLAGGNKVIAITIATIE